VGHAVEPPQPGRPAVAPDVCRSRRPLSDRASECHL